MSQIKFEKALHRMARPEEYTQHKKLLEVENPGIAAKMDQMYAAINAAACILDTHPDMKSGQTSDNLVSFALQFYQSLQDLQKKEEGPKTSLLFTTSLGDESTVPQDDSGE
jgi:hypothetical protein